MRNFGLQRFGELPDNNLNEIIVQDTNGNLMRTKKRVSKHNFPDSRLRLNNPHLISPISLNDYSSTFPHYPNTLSQILASRGERILFSENELLALLRGIFSALTSLQLAGSYHGNIIPENIFFSPSDGIFMIYDNEVYEGSPFKYEKPNGLVYYSPEILEALKGKNSIEDFVTLSKSDVFAFGMVMLEAASLKSSRDCYNFREKSMNYELIDQRLALIRGNYPIQLAHVIKIMVTPDQSIRTDCLETFRIVTNQVPGRVNVQVKKYDYELAYSSQNKLQSSTSKQNSRNEIKIKPDTSIIDKKFNVPQNPAIRNYTPKNYESNSKSFRFLSQSPKKKIRNNSRDFIYKQDNKKQNQDQIPFQDIKNERNNSILYRQKSLTPKSEMLNFDFTSKVKNVDSKYSVLERRKSSYTQDIIPKDKIMSMNNFDSIGNIVNEYKKPEKRLKIRIDEIMMKSKSIMKEIKGQLQK